MEAGSPLRACVSCRNSSSNKKEGSLIVLLYNVGEAKGYLTIENDKRYVTQRTNP